MSRESGEAASSARQRVRWARKRLEGSGRGPHDVVGELRAVVYATNALEGAAVLYVAAARDRGCSWAEIGDALGVTRQAARQRYAGAMRRRESLVADWRRADLARSGFVQVAELRGVWEGNVVRVGVPQQRREQHREN